MHPSDLAPRVVTALALATAALGAVLALPEGALAVLAALISMGVYWEWLALSGVRAIPLRIGGVLLCAVACLVISSDTGGYRAAWIWLGLALWLGAFAWLRHAGFCANASLVGSLFKSTIGLLLALVMFTAATWVLEQPQGRFLLLYLIALVCTLDTLCYVLGNYAGGLARWPLIAPGVSPNKNFGVLLAALALTSVLGAGLLLAPWELGMGERVLVFAATMPALSFAAIGDLFSSLMKRHARVKDSGCVLPGHGGLVDRLDSLLAALPVFVATLLAFH
ncbi:phosphatidate cytidylyltransferase [Arenimonas soli]|nr:phosphatidate cytidylyltransferase [Arenimonas soli]